MKLRLIILIIVLPCIISLFNLPESNGAIVSDECEACHGLYPGMMEEAPPGEPQKFALQNLLCVNCHSSAGKDSIKILGGVKVPVVHNTMEPASSLAGGNFYYVA